MKDSWQSDQQNGDIVDWLLKNHQLIPSKQLDSVQIKQILLQLHNTITIGINGDVVEFGCYIGTCSIFIRRLLDVYQDDREFHVYDSFEGLPPKVAQDESPAGTQFKGGELSVTKKQFIHEFQKASLKLPVIHKGWFSELTADDVPAQIAFAFLDGDFYESIRDSLKLVLPRMTTGGTIIIDDYAREALPGVAKAVHDTAPQLEAKLRVSHNLAIIQL